MIAGPAYSALGGSADAIAAEVNAARATERLAARGTFQVHELTYPGGTVVREYVAPNGTVFGVAWNGPFKPDLKALLGASFARFEAAGQEARPDHRRLSVHASDLVIESTGRMRAFAGRAYLPAAFPAGATPSDIQ